MTRYSPLYQDWGQYQATPDRMLNGDLILNTTNVRFTTGSMQVTQHAPTANLSVDVAPGRALLIGNLITNEGAYYLFSDAVENVPIQTPLPTGSAYRLDLVVAQVNNQALDTSQASNFTFTTVVGTASTTPSPPALGTNQIQLATIRVNSGVSSIVNSNISDNRPVVSNAAGGDLTGTLPNPTVDGLQGRAVSATAPATNNVLTWNGSAWIPQATQSSAPSGAAGGDLSGTYPNPSVTMNLPAALASGAAFTSFTDSAGTVWVAKGGVNAGAWKKATDVLHAYWAMTGSLNTSATVGNIITFNANQYDDYGLYVPTDHTSGSFLIPLAGYWQFRFQMVFTPTAASQWVNCAIYMSGFRKVQNQIASIASAMPPQVYIPVNITWRCVLNDYIQPSAWASATGIAYLLGSAYTCFFQADYMGTG